MKIEIDIDDKITELIYDQSSTTMEDIISDCIAAMSDRCNQLLTKFYYEGKSLDEYLTPPERCIAQWTLKNNRQAGRSTSNSPDAKCLYMAIRGTSAVLAVACVVLDKARGPESFEKTLMVTILDECGIILENENTLREKREMEEHARAEELRANLLRSISHDLRTPLTGISGNAALLMEQELSETKQKQIYNDIYDDSQWLINLVENLLSITRIEANGRLTNIQPERRYASGGNDSYRSKQRQAQHHGGKRGRIPHGIHGCPPDYPGAYQPCEQRDQVHARAFPYHDFRTGVRRIRKNQCRR